MLLLVQCAVQGTQEGEGSSRLSACYECASGRVWEETMLSEAEGHGPRDARKDARTVYWICSAL